MAGIGFELKKLFKKEGIFNGLKASVYSTIVTIGPTLISIALIISFNMLLKFFGVSVIKRDLFQVTLMYSFVFAFILTSGYSMVLSRYIADKIFVKDYEDIRASLYGSIVTIVGIGSTVGSIFYWKSDLPLLYKLFAYSLFMENIIQIVLSTYVTALKNVKVIVLGFVMSFIVSIICFIIFANLLNIDMVLEAVISVSIGFLFLILILYKEIEKHFKVGSKNYFEFLSYYKKYCSLFFVNLFYALGLYIHTFLFWANNEMDLVIENTYVYAPTYDIAAFYALIVTLPTMIIFIVKIETVFFEKYTKYFFCINNGASYRDIELIKKDMVDSLYKELMYLMSIQLVISIASIVIGNKLLVNLGFTLEMLDIFYILVLGYYLVNIIFVIITILLYFDYRKGALISSVSLFVLNGLFTFISIKLGSDYYGIGLFISGVVSICIAFNILERFIKNMDYYIFCKNAKWSI